MDNNVLDVMGNAVVNNGVTFSNTVRKFGTHSAEFNFGKSLAIPTNTGLNFGTGDFTIELWHYLTARVSTYPTIFSNYDTVGAAGLLGIFAGHVSSTVNYQVCVNGAWPGLPSIMTSTPVIYNQWAHLALVRSNGVITLYVNGVSAGTSVFTGALNGVGPTTYIGKTITGADSAIAGYLDEVRITKGLARYTKAFVPPITTFDAPLNVDQYFDNNSLLMHMDGSAIDVMGNAVVNTGVTFSPTVSRFGTHGAVFNGSGYMVVPTTPSFAYGTGDFTIEMWLYPTTSPAYACIVGHGSGSVANPCIYLNSLTPVLFYDSAVILSAASPLVLNTWGHVALVRKSGSFSWYVNGKLAGSLSRAVSLTCGGPIVVGANSIFSQPYSGHIDDLRITKGVARYTSNFVPPTAAFPDKGIADAQYDPYFDNVVLGCPFDNSLVDVKGKTLTNVNGVSFSNVVGRSGKYAANFPGTAHLVVPPSTDWVFSADFTLEVWVHPTQQSNNDCHLFGTGGAGSSAQFAYSTGTAVGQGRLAWAYADIGNAYLSTSANIAVNTWTHLVVSRTGPLMRAFVNGLQVYSGTCTAVIGKASLQNYIGRRADGTNQASGYMAGLRVTKGIGRYVTAFTPVQLPFAGAALPQTPGIDPYEKQTTLLMHMDGSNNSVIFKDDLNTPITVLGTSALTTSLAKFGSACAHFNGTGTGLRAPSSVFDFKAGDFTVEAWVNLKAMPASDSWASWNSMFVLAGVGTYNTSDGFNCMIGTTRLSVQNNEVQFNSLTPHGMVVNTWYHLSYVRSNNVLTFYVNGVSTGSIPFTVTLGTGAFSWIANEAGQGAYLNGYVDELRITRAARYTSGFAVPTAPSVSPAPAVLLLLPLDDLTDSAGAVVTNSNVVFDTAVKKIGTASAKFTGNANSYLSVPHTYAGLFAGTPFTIECWVEPLAFTANSSYLAAFGTHSVDSEFAIALDSTGKVVVLVGGAGQSWNWASTHTSSISCGLTGWTHVAVVYDGAVLSVFQNGVNSLSVTRTMPINRNLGNLFIGSYYGTAAASTSAFNGNIDEFCITRGAKYGGSFEPSVIPNAWSGKNSEYEIRYAEDALAKSTFLHLGFDRVTPYDSTANSFITNNGVVCSTQQFMENGSGYFNGSSNMTLPLDAFDFRGNNFTVECWFYPTSTVGYTYLFAANWAMQIYHDTGTSTLKFALSASDNYSYFASAASDTPSKLNAWNHMAFVRNGNLWTLYLNGLSVANATASQALPVPTVRGSVGSFAAGAYPLTGFIDNFRVTRGVARYVANFTPPAR